MLDQLENRLLNEMDRVLRTYQQSVDLVSQRLKGYPMKQFLKEQELILDHLNQKLAQELKDYLQKKEF